MTLTDDEIGAITTALQFYLRGVYADIIDFEQVILGRTEPSPGIFQYDCPGQTVWLDTKNYAVTYERQKVTDGKVYYKWIDDPSVEDDMAFEYICPLEWKKTRENMSFLYCVAHEEDLE